MLKSPILLRNRNLLRDVKFLIQSMVRDLAEKKKTKLPNYRLPGAEGY